MPCKCQQQEMLLLPKDGFPEACFMFLSLQQHSCGAIIDHASAAVRSFQCGFVVRHVQAVHVSCGSWNQSLVCLHLYGVAFNLVKAPRGDGLEAIAAAVHTLCAGSSCKPFTQLLFNACADLSKLPLLEIVLKETLRLHCTAPMGSVRSAAAAPHNPWPLSLLLTFLPLPLLV